MKQLVGGKIRDARAVLLTAVYGALVAGSLYLAYEVRFDFATPEDQQLERARLLAIIIPVKLAALLYARQMGILVSFFGLSDFLRVSWALLASTVLLAMLRAAGYPHWSPPNGVLLIDFLLCVAALCGFRIGARILRERVLMGQNAQQRELENVAVIGAGETGASLVSYLINMPSRGFRPVAVLDDDKAKHGRFVHGIRVVGAPMDFAQLPALEGVRHAVIAMPSAAAKRVAEIALHLGRLGIRVETVPGMDELAYGRARVSRIRPVEIHGLLGRGPVALDSSSI